MTSDDKETISQDTWQALLDDCVIDQNDMNKIVMNYLVVEGYKDAAENFARESGGTQPEVSLQSIQDRMDIRKLIQDGRIEDAIDHLNDLNVDILDKDPVLHFQLLQQQFVELIRDGKVNDALVFAQDELAPLGERNPQILEDLEQTMTLLAFDPKTDDSMAAGLFELGHRSIVAMAVNTAILRSQEQLKAKLVNLLKLLSWAQDRLASEVNFPQIKHFDTCHLEY